MAKYLIHSCNSRQWYVDEYLIPSMLKQGILASNIKVWQDTENKGCLESCMQSFKSLHPTGGTWHLQDDVVISSNFKELTDHYDSGIVCGISTGYDQNWRAGPFSTVDEMWYSFPCIRIPNDIANKCAEWLYNEARYDGRYMRYVKGGKDDDLLFRYYLKQHEPVTAMNLYPNIVNHIDYLLGGSMINSTRNTSVSTKARYWFDDETLKELEEKLNERRVCN